MLLIVCLFFSLLNSAPMLAMEQASNPEIPLNIVSPSTSTTEEDYSYSAQKTVTRINRYAWAACLFNFALVTWGMWKIIIQQSDNPDDLLKITAGLFGAGLNLASLDDIKKLKKCLAHL